MTLDYLLKRLLQFFAIAFLAATINFFFPRMSGQDPIYQKLIQLQSQGVNVSSEEIAGLIETYSAKFGLDQPLWRQYLNYLGNMARFDFGVSIANYPATVSSMLSRAIPWTVGLLLVATLISFTVGTVIGAAMAWGKAPFFLRVIFPAFFHLLCRTFLLDGDRSALLLCLSTSALSPLWWF